MNPGERLIDGVFQGGGAKGLAYLGALEALESRGYWFRRVAGASAGSFVAALIACGYRALPANQHSLRTLLSLDHRTFQDGGWLTLPARFLARGGLFRGLRLTQTLDRLLKQGLGLPPGAPSPTFTQLGDIDLQLVASNLTSRQILVFNRQTTPDLPIAEAVRMSSSLPFLFEPCRWRPSPAYAAILGTVKRQVVVDGGILSNFPMFVFKDPPSDLVNQTDEDRARPKIGLVLVQDEEPGIDADERSERRRRARPVRRWWLTAALWLWMASMALLYAAFLGMQLYRTVAGPAEWEARELLPRYDLFYRILPVDVWLGGLPTSALRAVHLLIDVFTSLPRLAIAFLPLIIVMLAWSEPGRLLRQLVWLSTLGFDKRHVHSQDVVEIFVGPYSTARFVLSQDQREDVMERGYEAMLRFLPRWEARYGFAAGA